MRYFLNKLSVSIFVFTPLFLQAQNGFVRMDTIRVFDGNNIQLKNPWAGGHNFAQLSAVDLDLDGIKDLVVFDRNGNGYDKVTTYLNIGTPNQVAYIHAPQFEKKFPRVHDWMLMIDYNGDGKEDIFTYHSGDCSVYKNISTVGNLQFTLVKTDVLSLYQNISSPIPISMSPTDIPAFEDVNHDGDIDILTYSVNGLNIEYHENMSMERYGIPDSLQFYQYSNCWGHFSGSTSNCSISLNTCAVDTTLHYNNSGSRNAQTFQSHHSGNCIACLDMDGDGDKDLLNGALSCCNIDMLTNGGDTAVANMTADDHNFPSNSTSVNQNVFPCPFHLDVNNDGKRDLMVSPNQTGVSENLSSIIYYLNTGTDAAPVFVYQQDNFLQDNMIDVGEGAYPVFFDLDADGLTDILIGNNFSEIGPGCTGGTVNASITAYKNIGTITDPKFKFLTSDYAGMISALPGMRNLMPTFGDLDNDGDQDMIIGDYNGNLHRFLNTAGAGNPAVFVLQSPFNMADVSNTAIDVGAYAAPQLFDLDHDNLLDLVIGERGGRLYYYRNVGTITNAVFSLANDSLGYVDVFSACCTGYSTPVLFSDSGHTEMFVGSEQGIIYRYTNIDANLNGTFTKHDSLFSHPWEIWEGNRIAIACADVTNDGKLDMLVGNYRGGLAFYEGDLSSGIDPQYENDLFAELYPNPTSNSLNFKIGNSNSSVIEISFYNLLGEELFSKKINTLAGSIDVSSLANGIYICKIAVGNKQCIKKAVIRK